MKHRYTLLFFFLILWRLPLLCGFSTQINQIIIELALEHKRSRFTSRVQLTPSNSTPLVQAAQQDQAEKVALLLSHGAYQDHQEACIRAVYNAVERYDKQLFYWRIQSKSLEELCKRGAYVTQEQFEHTKQNTPVLNKHPKAIKCLLQQCAVLTQSRIAIRHALLEQNGLPYDLIGLVGIFEVGPDANYDFLLSCTEKNNYYPFGKTLTSTPTQHTQLKPTQIHHPL